MKISRCVQLEEKRKCNSLGTLFFICLTTLLLYIIYYIVSVIKARHAADIPLVINTWAFSNATSRAWLELEMGGSALDAVEQGCAVCEREQCHGTVGYGGSPDENGETTLDAMIMDGVTHDVGAVAALREVKDAISVARAVLEHTEHTLLVGSQATDFAVQMGFKRESLSTPTSERMHQSWLDNKCQPNFWHNVVPNPKESCGPYKPAALLKEVTDGKSKDLRKRSNEILFKSINSMNKFDNVNHDTIGMIAIDSKGNIAGGTSTNGARNKIPGRVGDSPVPGSGCYVDRAVGGAAATGDGDVMMRLLPSFHAVENMRQGMNPEQAAMIAIQRVIEYYPKFEGGVIAADLKGVYGAACHGFKNFAYTVASDLTAGAKIIEVKCS